MNWQEISEQISTATGALFSVNNARPVSGGDINTAYFLQGQTKGYFVKLNRAETIGMFAAEAAGLQEMAATRTIRVPSPVVFGVAANNAFLVLEYIEFGASSPSSQRAMGQQLAQMHRIPQAFFGWHRDNTIGSTPQPNAKSGSWLEFWRRQRLQHQLTLAAAKGYRGNLQKTGEKLCDCLGEFFTSYQPQPALLHGDLWGGNAATDSQGNPVIFDPACYFGDREADLAMTELFGGFSLDFYAAYEDTYPLKSGYAVRKKLYNLYHILNHLNLFGSSYLRQAENMVDALLSEVN